MGKHTVHIWTCDHCHRTDRRPYHGPPSGWREVATKPVGTTLGQGHEKIIGVWCNHCVAHDLGPLARAEDEAADG